MAIKKVSSGIPGLDQLVGGGFEEGSNTMVAGTPGTGKTTLALQFIYNGTKSDEPGLFVSASEPIEKMVVHYERFGWEIQKLVSLRKLSFVQYDREFGEKFLQQESPFEAGEFMEKMKFLIESAPEQPKRFALDSVSLLSYSNPSPNMQRAELGKLLNYLYRKKITSLFVLEKASWNNTFSFEDFLADTLIVLDDILKENERKRGVTVIKSRAGKCDRTLRPYELTDRGIVVYPDDTII